MLPLRLNGPADGSLSVLAVGAHPDDIEIGAGGTLLSHYVVLTGTPDRQVEAEAAARAMLGDAKLTVRLHDLPEGTLPSAWADVKAIMEELASSCAPDLVIGPSRYDAHQDHRTIAEILPTVFRDHLYLAYEIPKWDGDLGRPSVYFPMSAELARRKAELRNACFPSQRGRVWGDVEVFLGLARLRGMECRAPYAEAFYCAKSVFTA